MKPTPEQQKAIDENRVRIFRLATPWIRKLINRNPGSEFEKGYVLAPSIGINEVPEDAWVSPDKICVETRQIYVLVYHDSYDQIPDGAEVPALSPDAELKWVAVHFTPVDETN